MSLTEAFPIVEVGRRPRGTGSAEYLARLRRFAQEQAALTGALKRR